MDQRIQDAAAAAQEAFWTTVAAAFPEIQSGDFPSCAQFKFDEACTQAVETWVSGNSGPRST